MPGVPYESLPGQATQKTPLKRIPFLCLYSNYQLPKCTASFQSTWLSCAKHVARGRRGTALGLLGEAERHALPPELLGFGPAAAVLPQDR